jgi:G3E family GTPase
VERRVTAEAVRAAVPVTVLTGFLGSGKTTLLQRILSEAHGQRIAVIENEYGEAGIDHELLKDNAGSEDIVELSNGCICCSVRGDLVRILGDLQGKRGSPRLDRVVIETTGLADPGPVMRTLARQGPLDGAYRLDAVITVVDAKHGERTLDDFPEAQAQVGFADRLLLSKTDLVTEDEAARLATRLMGMNPYAAIARVHFGVTSIAELFDVPCAATGFRRVPGEVRHGDRIGSFVFRATRPFDLARLDDFLATVVDLYGADMLRCKGVLDVAGRGERVIFQGVQTLIDVAWGAPWAEDEPRASALVFIGRDLPRALFERELERCLVPAAREIPPQPMHVEPAT